MILNCRYPLVNKYLAKGFFIFENNSGQKNMLPNDVKLRINVIDQLDADFVMKKKTSINKHHKKIAYSEKYEFDL